MPTSTFGGSVNSPVNTATTGALTGDGTTGSKLAVAVDGVSIDVNGSNQIEAIGLVGTAFPLANGAAIQTGTTANDTVLIQAYDVNGTTYRTFLTATAANVPTLTVSQPSGGILAIIPPTDDPHVVGAIWNNSGTLAISAG